MMMRTPLGKQNKRMGAGKQPKKQQYVRSHLKAAQGGAFADVKMQPTALTRFEREKRILEEQSGEQMTDEAMEQLAQDIEDTLQEEQKEAKREGRVWYPPETKLTDVEFFEATNPDITALRGRAKARQTEIEKKLKEAKTIATAAEMSGSASLSGAPRTEDLISRLLGGPRLGKTSLSGPLGRMGQEREAERVAEQAERLLSRRTRMAQETIRDIDQIPGHEDLVDLPASAQRWLTMAPERWSGVLGQNPHWMGKILKDLHAAYRFPPRGASTGYLASVIRDLTAMLDKEEGRMMSSSHSRLRSRALLKQVRSRPNNPIPRYDDTLDYVETDYVRGVARVAPGFETYEAGPNVQQTYAMPHGDTLIGKGRALAIPHTEYATPEQRLLQKEAIHAVVGIKPRRTGYQHGVMKGRAPTHLKMGKTAGRRLAMY